MFTHLPALLLCLVATSTTVAQTPPIHLWLEPEWFAGVKGSFTYWTGTAKPTGTWGIAGPGISAEWSQGGESEWNSMGAPAAETKVGCHRDVIIPRAGTYTVWVRYVDHRRQTEPFRVIIEQGGKTPLNAELGVNPVVPANDEYQLFWGFSFGWGKLAAKLNEGPARLRLIIDKPGEAWRQVDAVLLTTDPTFIPHGREKPTFAYQGSFNLQPKDGPSWRGNGQNLAIGKWQRPQMAQRDFSMWTGIDADAKWWAKQDVGKLSLYDVLFQFSPPSDIRAKFHQQFAGRRDVPIMSFPHLLPGLYLGATPDLSPGTPLRQWLERTKTPFYILTNYATGNYTDKTGPATYAALTGPLAAQFLGYIHGEAVGTQGVSLPHDALAQDRRGHVDALGKQLRAQQAAAWSKYYKTTVDAKHWSRGISCLSVDSIALAHLFFESGARTVGYEIDATNAHASMRIAFLRGAARQYGGSWINYASGNFGDACNYFTQNPVVPRGAPAWFHSKYSITDGVSASWYRKLYYLNFLGGASAIYWEQSLGNQWMLPGPGTHPIQLSPFGRATEDFMAFVSRLPQRGEPYTPLALLLSHGHAYERVNNYCKMLNAFQEDQNDRELRELFNVCWYPAGVREGQPAAPDVQSMPSGVYGDIFDILVDRPERAAALGNYPVVWAAGDARLTGSMLPKIEDYLRRGGTLVTHIEVARHLPDKLLGFRPLGKMFRAEHWYTAGEQPRLTTPFESAQVELQGAKPLAWVNEQQPLVVRHQVGHGALIVILVPHGLGLDERAHAVLPYLMIGLTQQLLPVEVRLANGQQLTGEIAYQINRTPTGWLVALYNHGGIDKTQTGIARVDRRQSVEVLLRTKTPIHKAREWVEPRDLAVQGKGSAEIRLRLHPGEVQVVELMPQR